MLTAAVPGRAENEGRTADTAGVLLDGTLGADRYSEHLVERAGVEGG